VLCGLILSHAAILASGCGDDEQSPQEHAPQEQSGGSIVQVPTAQQAIRPVHEVEWLTPLDRTPPELWLASREAGADLAEEDTRVVELRALLTKASGRFPDRPRIIANRAVQLNAMLKEKNIEQSPAKLIELLAEIPGERQSIETFSNLCQHYFNLRLQGYSEAEALWDLRSRVVHKD
jgi:hypothetical protein